MQIDQKKNQSATSSTFFFIGGFKNMVLHTYVVAGRWIMAHTVNKDAAPLIKSAQSWIFYEKFADSSFWHIKFANFGIQGVD